MRCLKCNHRWSGFFLSKKRCPQCKSTDVISDADAAISQRACLCRRCTFIWDPDKRKSVSCPRCASRKVVIHYGSYAKDLLEHASEQASGFLAYQKETDAGTTSEPQEPPTHFNCKNINYAPFTEYVGSKIEETMHVTNQRKEKCSHLVLDIDEERKHIAFDLVRVTDLVDAQVEHFRQTIARLAAYYANKGWTFETAVLLPRQLVNEWKLKLKGDSIA